LLKYRPGRRRATPGNGTDWHHERHHERRLDVSDDWTVSKVTKQEAALRQLNESIWMCFAGRDALASHTVAAAAYGLIEDLGKHAGITNFYRDEIIRPERRVEYDRLMRGPQNFLKHADRDPEDVLTFLPAATVFLLFEAVELAYRVLTVHSKAMSSFRIWFIVSHEDLIDPVFFAKITSFAEGKGVDQTDKKLWAAFLDR
jgi:hypothetical protein